MYAAAVVTTAPELLYNPYSFAVHDDPYDTYRRLRDEAPAYWNPDLRFRALSRFGDVLEGFREDGSMSIPREAADAMLGVLGYLIDALARRRAGGSAPGLVVDPALIPGAVEEVLRFHNSNVTGWTHLPITFTPSRAG